MTDYTNLRKIVTGDIIVKCRLGNDFRRIPINQVPTYDELCLMMCRVFKDKIKAPDDIVLKYQDDEGDLISLLDDIDITHAISISNLLKVTIYDKTLIQQQPSQVQLALIGIRDTLNELIQSCNITEEQKDKKDTVESQKIRQLTPAELASFDISMQNKNEADEKSSVKELTITSPKAPSNIPYYPPPTTSTQAHQSQAQQQQQQQQQQQPQQPQVQQPQVQQPQQSQLQQPQQSQVQQPQQPQVPPPAQVQQPQAPQQPLQQQHQQHPYMHTPPSNVGHPQQPRPPQTPQINPVYATSAQNYNPSTSAYPLPPVNPSYDPRMQSHTSQPQPPRPPQPPQPQRNGYHPPPLNNMYTPQLPPQPRPPTQWN